MGNLSPLFFMVGAPIRSSAVWAAPHGATALPAERHRERGRGYDVQGRLVRGEDAVRHQLLGHGGAAGPVGAPGHAAPAAQSGAAASGGVPLRRTHELLAQQPEAGVGRPVANMPTHSVSTSRLPYTDFLIRWPGMEAWILGQKKLFEKK